MAGLPTNNDCSCSRRHYIADRQPLEAAFYQLYQSRSADLKFGISKDAGHIQQTAQRIFLRELCERQLVCIEVSGLLISMPLKMPLAVL